MKKTNLAIILSLLVLGASPQVIAKSPSLTTIKMAQTQAQYLPISAKAIIKGRIIKLEVAKTSEQQATGLMFRTNLPSDRGMLFDFGSPRQTSFWMKNTLIPLDMIFLSQGKVKGIIPDVPPCKSDPCPSYSPGPIDVDGVIELKAGKAKQLGLKVGDTVKIRYINNGDH